jgi:carbohydrate kinase (thermoresistant glucokinase family)
MGVTGSGKSTVGARVAAELGLAFVDGDTLHSAEARAQIASGVPLTEEQRGPWLDRCHDVLVRGDVVLACSALTVRSRARLARDLTDVEFVALLASTNVLEARLTARAHHFAGPELLPSQLFTLELDPSVKTVDADRRVEDVVAAVRAATVGRRT